jgi:predicted regulator of Ras-like GTPase activity (Roadblock/LC7/MglB family)
LLGPEDEEARKEIAALKRRIRKIIAALAVARDALVLRACLSKKEEKEILGLARRFRRLLVWLER